MLKPKKARYDLKTRTSHLYFPWDEVTDTREEGEYYMRGGICFPVGITMPNGELDVIGHAIMAGFNVNTGITTIFEEKEFVLIENVLDDKGGLEYEGLGQWLNKTWARYFAKQYYHHQDFELVKNYRLKIIRDETIIPKPELVKTTWDSDEEAQHLIWKYIKMKKIKFDRAGSLPDGLKKMKQGEKEVIPAVHALQCLLAGLERHSYRRHE